MGDGCTWGIFSCVDFWWVVRELYAWSDTLLLWILCKAVRELYAWSDTLLPLILCTV